MPSATQSQSTLRVLVPADHAKVELVLPANLPASLLTQAGCLALLRQEGVEITADVAQAIQRLVEQPSLSGHSEQRILIARATPPVPGQDGWIDWEVDRQQEQTDQQASHYERSAYVMVKPGQVLGCIRPPTPGQDGRDVLGRTIPARMGKPINLQLDESVSLDANGQLVAQMEGSLCRTRERISIGKIIEVQNYVDFSTGNIDASGDVNVGKGIRDLFVVKATGNIVVGGLIEGATLEAGGDLVARGGMAGHQKGSVQVGGNLQAKYLDSVTAQVKGDVFIDREVINSNMVVHGSFIAPGGMIIGGRTTVVGKVQVAAIGSPAGVATTVVLGSVPQLEPLVEQLQKLLNQANERRDELLSEQKQIEANGRRQTATDKERQTEIMFELQGLLERIAKAQVMLDALNHRVEKQRTVHLDASKTIHSGVVLRIGQVSYQVTNDLRGPVRIVRDDDGDVVYRFSSGAEGGRLAHVAQVSTQAA